MDFSSAPPSPAPGSGVSTIGRMNRESKQVTGKKVGIAQERILLRRKGKDHHPPPVSIPPSSEDLRPSLPTLLPCSRNPLLLLQGNGQRLDKKLPVPHVGHSQNDEMTHFKLGKSNRNRRPAGANPHDSPRHVMTCLAPLSEGLSGRRQCVEGMDSVLVFRCLSVSGC